MMDGGVYLLSTWDEKASVRPTAVVGAVPCGWILLSVHQRCLEWRPKGDVVKHLELPPDTLALLFYRACSCRWEE